MFEDDDTLLNEGSFDPSEVVATFIEAWAAKDFDTAYNQLATNSPLRQGLSQAEWVKRREDWAKQARPANVQFDIADDEDFGLGIGAEEDADEEDALDDDEDDANQSDVVEVFWSLEMVDTALGKTLEELPNATIVYPETGRHWFWTKYTVVEDEEDYRILDIDDEGTAAQQLPLEELQQRVDAQLKEIESMMQDLGVDPNVPVDVDALDDEEAAAMALGIGDPTELLQHLTWLTQRGMHYSDALIAKSPADMDIYDRAAAQAALLQDWERSAAYVSLIAERFPEQRGETLSNLAIIVSNLVTTYDEQGMTERAEQFANLIEKLLRESIETDDNFTAHILLANFLVDEGKRLSEAETLLKKAQSLAKEPTEQAQVQGAQGNLAEARGDGKSALAHYQKAAQLHPGLPNVWVNIGDLQSKMGLLKEAEQSYQQAISINPDESYPYVELASLYTAGNQFEKAHDILDQGMQHSDSADLFAAHALTHIYQNDLNSANDYLTEAEEIDPDHEMVQNVRRLYESRKSAQKRSGKASKPNRPNNPKKKR
jgi:tetratricopeptide (TPR) repeat protein